MIVEGSLASETDLSNGHPISNPDNMYCTYPFDILTYSTCREDTPPPEDTSLFASRFPRGILDSEEHLD